MKKVLVLGAGLVTRPIVDFFLDRPDVELTVGSPYLKDAQGMIDGRPGGQAASVSMLSPVVRRVRTCVDSSST